MIFAPVSSPKFLLGWLPALAVSASLDGPKPLGEMFLVPVAGLPIPVVTCALGVLGIALSRPFARRTEQQLQWPLRVAVTVIMLITVQLWIVESRPGWLFAFVVSIGMGFSGYSLIELFGEQVMDFTRNIFSKAKATIGRGPQDQE